MSSIHIEHEWYRQQVAIWILESRPRKVLRLGDGLSGHFWEPCDENELPEPTLRLPVDIFDALAQEMGHHTQASDATVEALRDTRQVRDRLLTLVEKAWS